MISQPENRRPFHASRPAYQRGFLNVGDGHRLYYEQSGNPAGIPVVYLHGGPGGSISPNARRFFSAKDYRLIMFDQRGCGKSEPLCALENNTTQALVVDIEKLREELGIDKWLVFGGSWGSTLALAYAQEHADKVTGLVLRGLFLGTDQEIDYFLHGSKHQFPEIWQAFTMHVQEDEPGKILEAYWQRLTNSDHSVRLAAARAWSLYESSLVTLHPSAGARKQALEPEVAMPVAVLEAYYFRQSMFLTPDQLIRNIQKIRDIPAVLIHGRYDMICAVAAAQRLAKAWPELALKIIPDAGHASTEPGTATALMNALDEFAIRLSGDKAMSI